MKINTLKLTNFRCFRERKFSFSDRFNLLIGDNGIGKTALLDALGIASGCLFIGFDGVKSPHIDNEDASRVSHLFGDAVSIEPVSPVSVEAEGVAAGERIRWKKTLGSQMRTEAEEPVRLTDIFSKLRYSVQQGEEVVLPIIAYYGTGRLWLQKKEDDIEPAPPGSRLEGYRDCLDPRSDERMLTRWLKSREYESVQRGKPSILYEAVKTAVADCIAEYKRIFFDIRYDTLMTESESGHYLPAYMFSDGYRNMLAMAADIAYRMALLNPHLGPEVTRRTPGIVLIDEIDLHLHPRWQRRVAEDLKRTFPRVQMIATTHSPFVIQSLRPGELINLSSETSSEYADESIEDIAEEIMDVEMPQKSRRYIEMVKVAEDYYKLLGEGRESDNDKSLKKIKARLDELTMPFSDDPAFMAFLRLKRTEAGLSGDEYETG